jgi:phage tail sheath protein FI
MNMPFQVSPGVNVSEIDLTTVVPAVSTTEGAFAGVFRWGPVSERVLIDSEQSLVARFGRPTSHNPETFFTAANFLSYGNKLYVVRVANTTGNADSSGAVAFSAIANSGPVTNTQLQSAIVKNEDSYDSATFNANVFFVAKYPGDLGNSLKISVCDSSNQFSSNAHLNNGDANIAAGELTATVGNTILRISLSNTATGTLAEANTQANTLIGTLTVGDYVRVGNSTIGEQYMKVSSVDSAPTANSTHRFFDITCETKFQLSTAFTGNTLPRFWEYYNAVDGAPGQSNYVLNFGNTSANDELHVVVSDEDGVISGVPGTILEVFERVSRATDAKSDDGASIYYKNALNNSSAYVYWGNQRSGASVANAASIASSTNSKPQTINFNAGTDANNETNVALGTLLAGYDLFTSAEDVDVSLILTGKSRGGTNGEQIGNYLIDNIAEVRRDCVVFVSPDKDDVVNNAGDEGNDVVTFRNSMRSSSYAVLDSGYKYQYDKYNDVYRWIPLNGDIAGLCVRTDDQRDPWFSPAGYNRGQVKNIIKLAYNPTKAYRDLLYKNGVNPVVTFPGQGTVLFGDKTLLAKPSAFDRINVRRLFIVLEKAIATAAKFTLFEFNDDFTRAQFRNLVEPFLRDVQGRRGIYDFKVVCDGTNNTGEVIDRNEFVGDIYIKPAKSINFIQLNFVAVRTGVEFSEVVGQF